jgi:hypothetical protein
MSGWAWTVAATVAVLDVALFAWFWAHRHDASDH